MTDLEQRLTGETKVLRDLLSQASDVLSTVLDDNDMEIDESTQLAVLISQIDGALFGPNSILNEMES